MTNTGTLKVNYAHGAADRDDASLRSFTYLDLWRLDQARPGAEHGDVKMKVLDTVQDQLRDLFGVTCSIGGPNR
jgi:hypothetical protein